VALTLAGYCDTDRRLWGLIGEQLEPPHGSAVAVVGVRSVCLSFARRGETVTWTRIGSEQLPWGWRADVADGSALADRGIAFLAERGEDPTLCTAVGNDRVLGDLTGVSPPLDRVVDELRGLYLRSAEEADVRWGFQHRRQWLNPRHWLTTERQARRRLIDLQLNKRLVSL
jgi:hypothetical protein